MKSDTGWLCKLDNSKELRRLFPLLSCQVGTGDWQNSEFTQKVLMLPRHTQCNPPLNETRWFSVGQQKLPIKPPSSTCIFTKQSFRGALPSNTSCRRATPCFSLANPFLEAIWLPAGGPGTMACACQKQEV